MRKIEFKPFHLNLAINIINAYIFSDMIYYHETEGNMVPNIYACYTMIHRISKSLMLIEMLRSVVDTLD